MSLATIEQRIKEAGYDTTVSNSSCEDFSCINVFLNGHFIGEPMFFKDGSVQVECETYPTVDAFILRITEYIQESKQNIFD